MQNVGFIGMGNFGYALATHVDRANNPEVQLWVYDRKEEVRQQLRTVHTHPTLYPLTVVSQRLQVADSMEELASKCEVVVLAVVSTALTEVLAKLKGKFLPNVKLVSTMKALDRESGQLLSTVMDEALYGTSYQLAIFAGGTTGTALTMEEYLGATLASYDLEVGKQLQQVFQSPYLRVQLSTDVIGVQYASSFKNTISVLVGLLKGLGFDYGTQTHALSLIATECEALALTLGAQRGTFSFASQCWGNDMVMSATSATRNHQLGLMLGEGVKFSDAVVEMKQAGKTAESANTLAVLPKIADLSAYPLLNFLAHLARDEISAHEVVKIIETSI